jgi:cellulose synthase/poly-beta-1,6-N-acetylglucosamine synthase-like glycosyltransferase
MQPLLPSVSIVIPAYNEQETIRACVLAAIQQSVPASEIIVVSNRSTDATVSIVRALQQEYPAARILLFEQNLVQGLIPTRNFGLDRAHGEVLGRIDADSVLDFHWVEEVQKAFVDATVSASTGPVNYYDMPLQRFLLRADDTVRRMMLQLAREYHFVFGSNMALRASAWKIIRDEVCLDVADELHEDIDISVHLQHNGLKVAYVPTMVASISARRVDDSPRDYYYYMTRFERTYNRHNVRNIGVRAPMWLGVALYPALKVMRKSYAARN